MIVYLDSSVLARAYLTDEDGHDQAVRLLEDSDTALITGTWTRVEVTGALVRAARAGRADERQLLDLLDADIGDGGPVTVVAAPQADVEDEALRLVRAHGIRAMEAWHLAVASLTLPTLTESGEEPGFASRERAQAAAAKHLGFTPV